MDIAYHLRSERLHLEAFDPAATAEVLDVLRSDQNRLARYMPFAVEIPSHAKQADVFTGFRAGFVDKNYFFFIRERSTERFLGGCGLHPEAGPLGRVSGYWLREDAVGQGYASEALTMLCHLAFHQEGVDRVELHIEPDNDPSIAVGERLGFTKEALLRRRFPWPNEAPRDVLVFTLFRSEFDRLPLSEFKMERFDSSDAPLL